MAGKRRVPRSPGVERSIWDKMLAAYRERPVIQAVMAAGGVGRRIARRAIMEGWPDQSLPPFVELMSGNASVHHEMAKVRESWETSAVTQGEAARQAAEEALAARVALDSSIRSARIMQRLSEKLLTRIELDQDEILGEELNPKLVLQVLKGMEAVNNTIEKAIRIQRMHLGSPESALGVEIGMLLDTLQTDELEVVAETGEIPMRVLDQRKMVGRHVDDETAAEAAALESGRDDDPDDRNIEEFMRGNDVAARPGPPESDLDDDSDLIDDDPPDAAVG